LRADEGETRHAGRRSPGYAGDAEAWERRHYPLDLPDPVEAIKHHMDQNGLKPRDLIPFIGSRNRVREVFNRPRSLTPLEAAFDQLLNEDLENRVLDFDSAAANAAAVLAAARQKMGQPIDMRDTQIAGIVVTRHATLATRNVRHLADLKMPIVDPWVPAPRR
jgi:hypothetical protein